MNEKKSSIQLQVVLLTNERYSSYRPTANKRLKYFFFQYCCVFIEWFVFDILRSCPAASLINRFILHENDQNRNDLQIKKKKNLKYTQCLLSKCDTNHRSNCLITIVVKCCVFYRKTHGITFGGNNIFFLLFLLTYCKTMLCFIAKFQCFRFTIQMCIP